MKHVLQIFMHLLPVREAYLWKRTKLLVLVACEPTRGRVHTPQLVTLAGPIHVQNIVRRLI